MTLEALRHIVTAARALAEDRDFLVLGSASLLVSFPKLALLARLHNNRMLDPKTVRDRIEALN
jgi:hypothetical protein